MSLDRTDKIALLVLSETGIPTAQKIQSAWPAAQIYGLTGRTAHSDVAFAKTGDTLRELYASGTPIIGFCATGILIRALAQHISDKRAEPPVLSISDDGAAVVPLLGGLTGANELAVELATITNGKATLTANGARRFGLQLEAPPKGYTLANPQNAKTVTSDLLAGAALKLHGSAHFITESDLPVADDGTIPVHITVHPQADHDTGLIYHPQSIIAVPKDLSTLSRETIGKACEERSIAPSSVAAVLVPEGTEIPAADERADIPTRYGSAPVDVTSHGEAHGIELLELPTPEDVRTLGRPHGELTIVGLGPGAAGYLIPDARDALTRADDLVGYDTYLDLVPTIHASQTRHASGNRVEIERAEQALDLAVTGRRVALVTSGDPGIFAMASAVMEALEANPGRWTGLDVTVVPGVSAMQTAAARIGAPLGHDFCTISLSDIRKPWDTVAQRLIAAARADFVIALYNPASKTRREQIRQAKHLLLDVHAPDTPVVLGRNLGRNGETVTVTTLGSFDPDTIDMRTILIIGSSQTRTFEGPGGRQHVYTPRTYEADADQTT